MRSSIRKAGQKRPGIFAFLIAKPPLQNLTEAMGVFKCKTRASEAEASPSAKGILYRKALRTVSDR